MEIKEKFFRKDRWYIKLDRPMNGQKIIPYANYIWLNGNPSFKNIPEGYVIHHLDHNEQNDDISNLVLMQRHHHTAHHFKQKIVESEIKLNLKDPHVRRTVYYPTRPPHIEEYRPGRFRLRFREKIDGKSQVAQIYTWDEHVITTKEMAEKIKSQIWPRGVNGVEMGGQQ